MKKILLMTIAGIFVLGCGQKKEAMNTGHKGQMHELHMDHPGTSSEVTTRQAHNTEVGNPATCPVMGNTFTIKETTKVAVYKGKTYLFCCAGCYEPFKKNPEKYT